MVKNCLETRGSILSYSDTLVSLIAEALGISEVRCVRAENSRAIPLSPTTRYWPVFLVQLPFLIPYSNEADPKRNGSSAALTELFKAGERELNIRPESIRLAYTLGLTFPGSYLDPSSRAPPLGHGHKLTPFLCSASPCQPCPGF